MWEIVTHIASTLVSANAKMGTKWVLICLPEGLQQVCAVWGVLRAGCGYVPIDSETQMARLRILFKETSPSAVIGEVGAVVADIAAEFGIPFGSFPRGCAKGLVMAGVAHEQSTKAITLPMPAVDDLALLLFSSGSTGLVLLFSYILSFLIWSIQL
jgi:non-ribosomal peptide synthetase component F